MINTIFKYLDIALAIVVVLLAKVLKPVLWIRFGTLPSIRIGHYAAEPELYLCMRDAGLLPQDSLDLFWNMGNVSNTQLETMWKRVFHMHPFYHRLYTVARDIFKWNDLLVNRLPHFDRDVHGLLPGTRPHLSFTAAEHERGKVALREMGVTTPYICYHSRDNGYSALGMTAEQRRMYQCRNSEIETFVPAMDAMAEAGYCNVRMGISPEKALPARSPTHIDYAQQRTDFMDLYLEAHCAFHVGDSAGLAEVPKIFRRPLCIVNIITLHFVPTGSPHNLFIPKKQWLPAENRFLTFRETIERGYSRFQHCTEFLAQGIELVDNTAEEIQAVVLEMHHRLNGTWEPDPEDEELQAQFWALFNDLEVSKGSLGRIGAQYLRNNRDLLAEGF